MLPDAVKEEFAHHVKIHEDMLMQKQLMDMLQMMPPGGEAAPGDPAAGGDTAPPADSGAGPGGMLAGNGQVPDMTGGGPNG